VEKVFPTMVIKSMDIHVLPKFANVTTILLHLIYGCLEELLTHLLWFSIISLKLGGLIHGWGSKKRKMDSRTFVKLFFANNTYLKQI